ncbi:MAG: hypothetical protein JO315_22120 [Acidobacteria bacterium]|nr:hypothetical protein [Acidobacteriota bacterium]
MHRGRGVGLLLLVILGAMTLIGASAPLNPLVVRNPKPSGAAPAECEEGLTTAPQPRVDLAELEAVPEIPAMPPVAPPRNELRSELELAQRAITSDDRPAFEAHLERAKEIVDAYPPGGDRTAAQDVLHVYDDIARVWTTQFEGPFFDESSGAYAVASAYPGYRDAIADDVLTDQTGRRFYPARETRQFLAALAASRLPRLGIHVPAPPRTATRHTTVVDEPYVPLPPVHPRGTSHKPSSTRSAETTTHASSSTTRKPSTHVADATRSSATRSSRGTTTTPAPSTSTSRTPTSSRSAAPRKTPSRVADTTRSSPTRSTTTTTFTPPASTSRTTTPSHTTTAPRTTPTQIADATRPSTTRSTSTPSRPAPVTPPATATHAPAAPPLTTTHAPSPAPASSRPNTPPPAPSSTAASTAATTPSPITSPSATEPSSSTSTASTSSSTSATTAPSDTASTDTSFTTSSTSTTDTSVTAAPSATSDTASMPAAPAPSRGRSIVLPAILILIGLGVLIVLFRASQ